MRPVPRSSRGIPRGSCLAGVDVHGQKAREKRIPSHGRRVPPFPDGARGSSSLAPSGGRAAKGRSGGAKTGERLTVSPSRLAAWRSRRSLSPSEGSKAGERGAKRSWQDGKAPPDGRGTGE